MQDRPTYDEMLAAVEHFLDIEIVPSVPGSRGFHARVAANAIRIVRRELQLQEEQLAAEWAGLDELLGRADPSGEGRDALARAIQTRNDELCGRIRRGDADAGPYHGQVLAHVRRTVREKLAVSDPGLLQRSEGHPAE